MLALLAGCAAKPDTPAEESYPLPSIPTTVTDPAMRASIAASHFWDEAVTAQGVDTVTPLLEQSMSNFLAISAMGADLDSVSRGIRIILSKAGSCLIMPLAEHYLYDPNSPMRSEELFMLFLQQAPEWERTGELTEIVNKNRVGTTAADFGFIDSKGRRSTLAEFVSKHGGAFIYFFDSECNVCKSLIPDAADAAMQSGMAVLAICPEANAAQFDENLVLFPDDWVIARDLGTIDGDDLYIFPALPSVYVIDSDMTVIAKDMIL